MVWYCRNAPPGVALVASNSLGSVNTCSPPIVAVITTKMIVGRSSGTVTPMKVRQRFAPSTTAASMMSRGMACMAARKISAL